MTTALSRRVTEEVARGPFQPPWPDLAAYQRVVDRLSDLPPLVAPRDIDRLAARMAAVARGEETALMAGDCATRFMKRGLEAYVRDGAGLLVELSLVLQAYTKKPVVRFKRAVNCTKPRTEATQKLVLPGRGEAEVTNYFGDAVNELEVGEGGEGRIPDPERLITAYNQAMMTYMTVNNLTQHGELSLRRLPSWTKLFRADSVYAQRYDGLVERILETIELLRAFGMDFDGSSVLDLTKIYFAREVLLPDAEWSYVRTDDETGEFYHVGTHFPWAGVRTNDPAGPQIELLSRVMNPVGAKIGPGDSPEKVLAICEKINPDNVPGRLTLIVRMGMKGGLLDECLPPILAKLRIAGRQEAVVTDPVHGNTIKSGNGYKTRRFETVLGEARGFNALCKAYGRPAGGYHIEVAPRRVTEVLGGPLNVQDYHLGEIDVDPRLDPDQALEFMYALTYGT